MYHNFIFYSDRSYERKDIICWKSLGSLSLYRSWAKNGVLLLNLFLVLMLQKWKVFFCFFIVLKQTIYSRM